MAAPGAVWDVTKAATFATSGRRITEFFSAGETWVLRLALATSLHTR